MELAEAAGNANGIADSASGSDYRDQQDGQGVGESEGEGEDEGEGGDADMDVEAVVCADSQGSLADALSAGVALTDAAQADDDDDDADEEEEEVDDGTVREGKRHLGVLPVRVFDLPRAPGGKLVISQGSVVGFGGDAIVNAANSGCQGGGGVDGAISRAGGQALADAREALPLLRGSRWRRCRTGGAVITVGGALAAAHCIHAVGPDYGGLSLAAGDTLLRNAYKNAMRRAKEAGLKSVAFSLISSGIFRGDQSLNAVLGIGLQTVMDKAYPGLEEVHLCGFTRGEVKRLVRIAEELHADELARAERALASEEAGEEAEGASDSSSSSGSGSGSSSSGSEEEEGGSEVGGAEAGGAEAGDANGGGAKSGDEADAAPTTAAVPVPAPAPAPL